MKWNDAKSKAPLLDCLEDIKAWLALHFLKFNEEKTYVVVFGSGGAHDSLYLDLRVLRSYVKTKVKHLGVIVDRDFKLDKQVNSVITVSFFQLRQSSKVKSFLSFKNFEWIIHICFLTRLDYGNVLYVGISQAFLTHLRMV